MKGPLAAEMYDAARPVPSWWEASLPPEPPRPPLAGRSDTDVAIIGAGFAGLNAARELAARGIEAVVLDAGRVGWGASGRNGGIVGIGGHKLSAAALLRRHGPAEAERLARAQVDAVRWVRRFCAAEGLDWAVSGDAELIVAHSPHAAREVAEMERTPPADMTVDLIPPSGRDDIASHGGALIAPGFGIQPLAYVRALAGAAEREGVAVFECSEVLEWHRDGARHLLVTAKGALRAERVLVATNGFTPDGLAHWLDGRAVPVISNIAVTRPLSDDELARHPWLGENPAACTRNMLSYFRIVRGSLAGADGATRNEGSRLLLGMRGDLTGADAHRDLMCARVADCIAADLPGLAGTEIDFFWRGPVCATLRFTPAVGWLDQDRRIACALGWHGSGIAMGSYGGRLAGEMIATGADAHVPAAMKGPPPRIPLPGLRPVYVAAMQILYAGLDRIAAARPRRD